MSIPKLSGLKSGQDYLLEQSRQPIEQSGYCLALQFRIAALPLHGINAIKLSEKKPIIENLQMDKKVGW